ncbi:ABC1 family protein, putative [Theobroma cacao]|uniref:ABC1 family protein, putative n=1 Tax=Theobroma cacao TaxID=3641 RepID=A0A061GPZ0_THECC|nr:ABC1 family protein, putative [Theobroma cacao]
MYTGVQTVQHREKWTNESERAALWEKAHKRNAKRVVGFMIEMKGLWVKLGQFLSTHAEVFPEAYISLLKQLQVSLPPRPFKEVCQTIQNEFGKTMDDLFADFTKEPLATASDLKNAKWIVDRIAWAEPECDFNPMMDEWCKETPNKLDFNHEAGFLPSDQHPYVVLLSTETVLILEYLDGICLNDSASLEAFGVNKQKIVEEITRAYAHQIYVYGLFNGDPHPGNFLVSKEAPHRPILLDFGLTMKLSSSVKQALAKMFLASAEGDHVALLSALSERGLKLRLDLPEEAMMVTTAFFRSSTPANKAHQTRKSSGEQSDRNKKLAQEKKKSKQKEVQYLNPVDAFPGNIVLFTRVLMLLRGLSSTMSVRIVYLDIMRPFAESVLLGWKSKWIYNTPVHSDVEAKLRQLLVELGNNDKILGIQDYIHLPKYLLRTTEHAVNGPKVCAYKDGEVIIDSAAGVLGRCDPRPVQPDTLFSVFSATKGITAGMLHWLVDNGYHASRKKFQEILEEAFIHPLKIEGELYVGTPPDTDDLNKLSQTHNRPEMPSTFQLNNIAQFATSSPALFNMLNLRRAIIPAANGHCSARALARYYAALADGGVVPPPHSSLSNPPLGSHPHIPNFLSRYCNKDFKDSGDSCTRFDNEGSNGNSSNSTSDDCNASRDGPQNENSKIFSNARIHDAFLGVGEYGNLALPSPDGIFGLGFRRLKSKDGSFTAFGHSGMGGSAGFCDIKNRFAIAVTLNKMSFGGVTAKIIELVCSELNLPLPEEFSGSSDAYRPLIN